MLADDATPLPAATGETWVHRSVRKVALRQLSLAAILVAGVLFGWTLHLPYWRSFIAGAVPATREDLLGTGALPVSSQRLFAVHGDKTYDTGLTQVTTHTMNGVETGKETSAYYYLLRIGDQPLLVKGKAITTDPEGTLVPIPADIAADLFKDSGGARLQAVLMPRMLEASESYRENGYYGIGSSIAALALAAWLGLRGMRRIGDPRTHPTVQWMMSRPEIHTISADVERELAGHVLYKRLYATLTENYLVKRSFFSFRVHAMDDLLWCYKQVIQRRVNLIPAGKTHVIKMLFRTGAADLQVGGKDADGVLQTLAARRPWALYGYSEELKKLAKNPAAMAAIVDERRAPQILAGQEGRTYLEAGTEPL